MRALQLAAGLAAIALVTAVGGCICCCGLDGLLSKMKGPVTDIRLPRELSAGGENYTLLYSYDYLNRSAAKEGFREFIPRIGYRPDEYGYSVDQMMDVGGVEQYKWFEYGDAGGNVSVGGFLAKAGSPMGARELVLGIAAVATIAAVSGCICCCGFDSFFDRLKGPVTDIVLPPALSVGGQNYSLLYSYDYLNQTAAKAGFKAFIPRIGYSPDEYGDSVDQMMDVGGVEQYKWFEYGDADGSVAVGGFLAKAGSPLIVDSGLQSLNTMLRASTGIINDPDLNQGGAQNLTHVGATAIGGGGDLYHFVADYNGSIRDCYFVMTKYSNMYVAVYSFESFAAAEDVANQSIAWIDQASSGK